MCGNMLATVLLGCYAGYILAATPQHCSEYLISGLYGVDDSALTATTSHKQDEPGMDFFPKNARLYSDVPDALGGSAAWCSNVLDTNQYLQIQFPQEIIINAVMIQGRHYYAHYVTSFHLLYSMDGVTWTTVTTPDGNPKVFPGNTDSDTVVTTAVSPPVTGKYVRVNPQAWSNFLCLRFGLSGCYLQPAGGCKRFKKASVTSAMALAPYSILQKIVPTFVHCSRACHAHDQCVSFTFSSTGNACTGYSMFTATTFASHEIPYFYTTVLTDGLSYKPDHNGTGLYKVNEIRQNQSTASQTCGQQYSELIQIVSPQMAFLHQLISNNTIMSQDYRFYVSGQYVTDWRYGDGTQITDNSLWSPSQPNPAHGSCVMLTQTGLSSVACSQLLFSICRHAV